MFAGKTRTNPSRVIMAQHGSRWVIMNVGTGKFYKHRCDTCGKEFWKDSQNQSNWICMVKKHGREKKSYCRPGCQVVTHHGSKEKLFKIWQVKKRDQVGVCDEWKDYSEFRRWALSNGWEDGKFLFRTNKAESYSPSNVRIVSTHEWGNIRVKCSHTKYLTFEGETLSVSEWARRIGTDVGNLHWRIRKGWPVEDVLASKDGRSKEGRRWKPST